MLQENQIFARRYRLVKRLGQGAFSEVWKAEDIKAANMVVALKIYAPDKGMDEDGVQIFSSEFTLVFNVSHKNLLTPTYFDDYEGSPFLVLPFCEKGNAQKLVGKLSEKEVAKFMFDVSNALAFLHKQDPPIIHQDIKPENVLIDSTGMYRVTDFGISTNLRSTLRKSMGASHINDNAGTMAYMGPERFNKNRETIKASDVWSLGATVYEMMCGDVPFGEFGGLAQKNGAEMPEFEGDFTNSLKQLVLKCLAPETWDRPTAADVCEICYQYIHNGYWDLSLVSPQTAQQQKSSNSRGTQRKVPVMEVIPTPRPIEKKGHQTNQEEQQRVKKERDPETIKKIRKASLITIGSIAAAFLLFFVIKAILPSDDKVWAKAQSRPTMENYLNYMNKYPNGIHMDDAKSFVENEFNGDLSTLNQKIETAVSGLAGAWSEEATENSVQEMNSCYDESASLDSKLPDWYPYDYRDAFQSRIQSSQDRMDKAIEEKINDHKSNLTNKHEDNISTIELIVKFKDYKGLSEKTKNLIAEIENNY